MRTTSSLESFNAVLNKSIAKRANLFKFVPRLRLHASRKEDEMIQLAKGLLRPDQFKRRKEKDQMREEKIQYLTAKYLNGKITEQKVKNFLREISADKNGTISSHFH